MLFGHGIQDDLGRSAAKEDCFSAGDQGTEPMHFGSRVVEGRNAEEGVILLLAVVFLLHESRVGDSAVFVQDRLGETSGTGGKIDRAVVIFVHFDVRCLTGIIDRLGNKILSE